MGIELIKRTWKNICYFPKFSGKEKLIIVITIIITFYFIWVNNLPRISLIFLASYFAVKAFLQLVKETVIDSKYKNISKLFNDKVKIIKIDKNVIYLNSFLPISELIKKKDHIEHFFNKNIESFSQNKKDRRKIKIILIDEAKKVKLKEIYPLSHYIKSAKIKGLKIPFMFGINELGKHIVLDIETFVHFLISGEPGGGKSTLVNTIIQSLLWFNSNISMILVDFKKVELNVYRKFKNCLYINDHREFSKVLEMLNQEMEDRTNLLMNLELTNVNQLKDRKIPTIILVIDEIADLKFGSDGRTEEILRRIGNMGRAARIFVICATQRGSSVQLNTEIRAFLRSKVSFNIQDAITQNMAGVKGTENLKLGEFKTSNMSFNGTVFKGYYVDREKEWQTFKWLQQGKDGVTLEKHI